MPVLVKHRHLLLLVALLIIGGSCSRETSNPVPGAKSVLGKVVKIVDGDTIDIVDAQNVQYRIRLQGIDAPERRQDFGTVARENLGNLIFGKHVRIEYQKIEWRGRLIGKVWLEGEDECLAQVRAGLAWHYKDYQKEQSPQDRQLYATVEQEARTQKRGLWKDPAPTPPWDFRHHKTGSNEESDSVDEPLSSQHNFIDSKPTPDRHSTKLNPRVSATPYEMAAGLIRGNKRSMIYHWPGCPNYNDISLRNRAQFQSVRAAEKAGYRAARNCP